MSDKSNIRKVRVGVSSKNNDTKQQMYWSQVEYVEDLEEPNSEGLRLLHLAVRNPEIVKDLLKRGAVVDSRCNQDFTPLFTAVQHGNCESAKLLINAGANPNVIENKYGNTPLWWALSGKINYDLVSLLLENGADPRIVNFSGKSTFWLVEQGAKRYDGESPNPFEQDLLMLNNAVKNIEKHNIPKSIN